MKYSSFLTLISGLCLMMSLSHCSDYQSTIPLTEFPTQDIDSNLLGTWLTTSEREETGNRHYDLQLNAIAWDQQYYLLRTLILRRDKPEYIFNQKAYFSTVDSLTCLQIQYLESEPPS